MLHKLYSLLIEVICDIAVVMLMIMIIANLSDISMFLAAIVLIGTMLHGTRTMSVPLYTCIHQKLNLPYWKNSKG